MIIDLNDFPRKRFMLFVVDTYESGGGLDDLENTFTNFEEAKARGVEWLKRSSYYADKIQILDLEEWKLTEYFKEPTPAVPC